MTYGKIGFLNLYVSKRDRVLTAHFLGGIDPAAAASQFVDEHHTTFQSRDFSHCAWFNEANFESSMRAIAGLEEDA